MRITRKAIWRGGRVYVRYSKKVTQQIHKGLRDVERIRQLATDPLAFRFDFDFDEGDC